MQILILQRSYYSYLKSERLHSTAGSLSHSKLASTSQAPPFVWREQITAPSAVIGSAVTSGHPITSIRLLGIARASTEGLLNSTNRLLDLGRCLLIVNNPSSRESFGLWTASRPSGQIVETDLLTPRRHRLGESRPTAPTRNFYTCVISA